VTAQTVRQEPGLIGTRAYGFWLQINNLRSSLRPATAPRNTMLSTTTMTWMRSAGNHCRAPPATLESPAWFDVYDVVAGFISPCFDTIGRRETGRHPRPPYNGATDMQLDPRHHLVLGRRGLTDQRSASIFGGQPSIDQQTRTGSPAARPAINDSSS
jgi:hypothetical protein